MTWSWHLALFVGVTVAVSAPCQGDAQRARVTIQIRDSFGDPVPPGDLTVSRAQGLPVYAGRATDGTELQLDYGQYTFVFKTKFFQEARREVTIRQADVLVLLPVQWESDVLDRPMNVPVSISLKLTPAESCARGGSGCQARRGIFKFDLRAGDYGWRVFVVRWR
jgi:hypothetical protein